MPVMLKNEVVELLRESETVKVLATVDENGSPHAVVKQSLQLGEDGNLYYLEFLETSRTNKNLLRSIWFDRRVSVILKGKGDLSYQIKGKPVRSIVAGPVFQEHYLAARRRRPDADPVAVWIIEPLEVVDESFSVRMAEEEALHPLFTHLDRIARHPESDVGTSA